MPLLDSFLNEPGMQEGHPTASPIGSCLSSPCKHHLITVTKIDGTACNWDLYSRVLDGYNDATPNLAKWNLCGNQNLDRSSKSSTQVFLGLPIFHTTQPSTVHKSCIGIDRHHQQLDDQDLSFCSGVQCWLE
ncbi:uncharacterized protein PGTG_03170 [Puccinia graminis f. sp. tritici CRL 75-36-700-3]|uniref:Uncharacterized protein n=1 Tax=Puccinia graminis f. sp. tritici (strain CRL 75-36-700-3 / race SCCL) TaxID=418459 RepID=E3JYT9_PUCGT|nr:uncharacterized protein PGTG_03170 [Puccinia graminis f. sp. tritici CRL 75-36-700-3]EFP77214.1 hypothetical protein PGTG_03170 [Puccinia graminis f. sp. tritici CRL 75-36-700-3]